jgi:hypothetical protein
MIRWLFVGLCALAFAASCKSSTPTGSGGDDDDAGDDGGACSPCLISSVAIPCGGADCVDGVEYQCSPGGEGAVQIALCGDDSDGGDDSAFVTLDSGDTGPCSPLCLAGTCGDDGCGGTCMCSADDVCDSMSHLCTNGCDEMAGDPCTPGSVIFADCCIDNTMCNTSEAGVSACCAVTGVPGTCQNDGDCCAYPQVHCNSSTAECQ